MSEQKHANASPPPQTVGVRAYARHRHCAPSSVVKAIEDGRLPSVTRDHRGRPRINAAQADLEWRQNRDLAKQQRARPPRVNGRATPAYAASCDLVSLIAHIEERLAETFRDAIKQTPDAPATHWEALYAEWGQLPDVLERLQNELRTLANNPKVNT